MTAALTDTAPASMLDRFTAIIDAFEDASAALTLDQISARARLPRSTTHRILDQLVRLRWLTHSGRGYRLGARTSSWGTGESADARLRSVAAPVLHDLHVRTGAVVHLGLLDRGHIVHLDKLGGASARQVPTSVGGRMPAHRLALGVAALAGLSPEDVVAELTHIRGWQPDPSWWGELHNVRRRVAVRSGDYAESMVSVAATVGSRAAIGVVTPDRILAQRCQPLVAAAAAGIARALVGATN
jgi:DNA-binding IclR family transcriptional regulator